MHNEKSDSDKLDEILELLKAPKQIMSFEQFCEYASISKSHGYRLTHSLSIPFYRPTGKLIYFEKAEVDMWLRRNRVKSLPEIQEEAERR